MPDTEIMRRYTSWLRERAAECHEAIRVSRNQIANLIGSVKTLEDKAAAYERDADELEDYAEAAEGLKPHVVPSDTTPR